MSMLRYAYKCHKYDHGIDVCIVQTLQFLTQISEIIFFFYSHSLLMEFGQKLVIGYNHTIVTIVTVASLWDIMNFYCHSPKREFPVVKCAVLAREKKKS